MKKELREKLYFNASNQILENAHNLRQHLTEPENRLWQALRNRKLKNAKFRRQHALLHFVADFYCAEKKLVIELDGGIHQHPEQKEYDNGRTLELEKSGLRIIRFKNEEVMNSLPMVLLEIEKHL